ncbi:Proton-dependent oligopeptide transporter family [Corchorus olitorius]|uniref:Proton-dependent oligopeptide transporter family n=1 Tax=Corchorus olitorius TaxID=93759 RepID=A0A1R3I4T3_9ROSI|nr:Proton-dependent oligopeptide transporter family [Corchorus olitorius]
MEDNPSHQMMKNTSIDNQKQKQKQKLEDDEEDTSKKGGLRTMPFVISNETFEKVAGIGLQANMILYLRNEYHMSNATGANVLFLWSAISNFMPILGAFLSDSFLGRFRVIALGTICMFPQARPPDCKSEIIGNCLSPKAGQLALLFSSFALMSIGAGGIRPCSLAFGADQFNNPNNPRNDRVLQSFFNWYYASVGISIMISITVIVYIQDKAGWVVGFGVPVGLMFFSTLMFLLGSPLYVKIKANKSLFTSFAQVIAASWKNRHMALPPDDGNGCYYHKGSKLLVTPTQKLRFLNKACVIRSPEKELNIDGWAIDPWSLCTVKEVEELKALIKVLPIWSTGIMLATTISQHTFPVLQASVMDRHLFGSNLKIPAGSFGIFAMIALTIWVAIYDRIVVPLLSKFTKRRRGLTFKERMGIGLVISCAATAVAATMESKRRAQAIRQGLADHPYAQVNMSAMWLVPQYCLIGLAEGFNAIGQIEFYYSQFPKSMASIGVALFSLGMAVGNLVGSLIVGILNEVTKKHGKVSWVSSNLNKGHYDYYYWLLTILSVINVFYYLFVSWGFGSFENKMEWDEAGELTINEEEEDEHVKGKGSPIVVTQAPFAF